MANSRLLETGSTNLIRNTAAQQLADVQKQHPDELFNLLSRVIPFLRSTKWDTRLAAAKAISGIVENAAKFDPNEANESIKDEAAMKEEEVVGNKQLGLEIGEDSAVTKTEDDFAHGSTTHQLQLAKLPIESILHHGKKLLGSGSKELDYALAVLEPAAKMALQQRSLNARLGLHGEYVEEEYYDEHELPVHSANGSQPTLAKIDTTNVPSSRQNSVAAPFSSTAPSPRASLSLASPDEGGLSKRQLNQLKRKHKQEARNQSRKVRIVDIGGAYKSTDSPVTPARSDGPSDSVEIKQENGAGEQGALFSLDPAAEDDDSKVVQEFKGAPIKEKSDLQTEAEEQGLEWPFERLCQVLALDLFDGSWEVRHGAAAALRDVLRVHGAGAGRRHGRHRATNDELNDLWLNDMACRFCCVLMLDRFGDYISDNVVAPICETAGQALAALLLHLSQPSTEAVYHVLHRMILQNDLGYTTRIWEVCHGGMLGMKYLGAMRKDMLVTHLDGILEAVLKGLTDFDDDVRAVSAATLVPIADDLVRLRPNQLPTLMSIVWDCLAEARDDLSASTGYVMDLLAKLCSYDAVLAAMMDNARADGADPLDSEQSFDRLVPRLFPFLRHTIPSVRSAVLRALQTFMRIEDARTKTWVNSKILRLLFQNLLVERNDDVLRLSADVWELLVALLGSAGHFVQEFSSQADAMITLAVTPIGVPRYPTPMDHTLIMKPSGQFLEEPAAPVLRKGSPPAPSDPPRKRRKSERREAPPPTRGHSVDAHMLQGDVDLVGMETLIRSRIYGAKALGEGLKTYSFGSPAEHVLDRLIDKLHSTWASTQTTAAMIVEETARRSPHPGTLDSPVQPILRSMIEDERPEWYSDLVSFLHIARAQAQSLLNAFRDVGRIPAHKIPTMAVLVQGDSEAGPSAFSIAKAEIIVHQDFERMLKMMSAAQRLLALPALNDHKANVVLAIEDANKHKLERDVRVKAAAAGALVAMKDIPKKVGQLIKALMDGIKAEENADLQLRSASSLSSLLQHLRQENRRNVSDKVIVNLMKFYCQDTSDTPEFESTREFADAILSLQKEEDRKDHKETASYESEARKARIQRRGAKEVLDHLSLAFGKDLFANAPTIQSWIESPLRNFFGHASPPELDAEMGQAVVDAFSVLRVLVPKLHPDLHVFVDQMMPLLLAALRCAYSVFRYAAAKCFATICSVWTIKAMTTLVEEVLPTIGRSDEIYSRQGAIETVYHLIHIMEDGILPYVVFLIVPILGRMSDANKDVRLIATTTFATLVKLVPLEAGIPDPPGFSEELLKGRDKERRFVAQMLDPKKTEPFAIPVAIKAELRSYQQDGVNWLAFLNRFKLHGVLCDDMGLGKTLQAICIVASDHHLRAEAFAQTQDPDCRRLPSLIVCPPTLSGHWQQEIQTYAPFLSAVAYVGPPSDRGRLQSRLGQADVVITSYDVCRNDIDVLRPMNWNYCVLDEGHLIKNPKAKTTIAVKELSSNHRLILSGTPIQNNVLELWSLFDFLMPGFLGTEKIFQDRFARPIAASRNAKSSSKEQERGALAIESLHKQVLPFLLRRLKEDVLDDLPPKIIQNYYCDLSELQRTLFEDFARRERKSLEATAGNDDKEAKQHIFQALQYMRKLCNSPSLVVKPGHKQYDAIQKRLATQGTMIRDVAHAPKLGALRDLLVDCGIGTEAATDGELGGQSSFVSPHRALIFCQMKEMLDIVQNDVLGALLPSVQYLRLDGSVEANKRQNIVNQFNTDPSFDVLLLTTSVGGLGLNLTGADTVIFVEHDWNPQKDLQAMDRAHRIGQKKVVNVYRLITRGTLEEKILNLQRFKIDVASTVVNQQNAGLNTMGTDQILDLFSLGESADGIDNPAPGGSASDTKANHAGGEEDMLDATGEVREKGKAGWLDGLGELWDNKDYEEEYNLDSFLASMKV